MDLNGVAAIITATGGALATVLTQILTWHSNRAKLEEAQKEISALKLDHERLGRDLGQKMYGIQDTVNTLDDRTESTQRLMEGVALAQGNTPIPVPVQPTPVTGPKPPGVQPIPTGSQPGFKR